MATEGEGSASGTGENGLPRWESRGSLPGAPIDRLDDGGDVPKRANPPGNRRPSTMREPTSRSRSRRRSERAVEGPYEPLSARLRDLLEESQKTIYQLSVDTGIDGAYIWRIVRGERVEVSREILMLMAIALVVDKMQVEQVVEMANRLLDAGGYKVLRGP
jgi:hypothetical protein